MAATINPLGFREVTPGKCMNCGFDDGWDADGRGTVYCECMTCPECGQFDGHNPGCAEQEAVEETCPSCGMVGGHDYSCDLLSHNEADQIARDCGVDPETT